MRFGEQVKLIKRTGEVHGRWYLETYPDVAAVGMDPAAHYLRYGAAMGRNPGKHFDTSFYLESHPDAAASGLNALVHYALYGQALRYAKSGFKRSKDLRRVARLRTSLLSLGFTDAPLVDLAVLAAESTDALARAHATRELALWFMREKSEVGYQKALSLLPAARRDAPDLDFRRKLATTEVLCHVFLGNKSHARVAFDTARARGEISPDLLLAVSNLADEPQEKLRYVNRALELSEVEPIALIPDHGRPLYDRMTAARTLRSVDDGPLVTVLIAAYDAAETLPTALRSLQEQTWRNLEIIVLDDCSPDADTIRVAQSYAAGDDRIRVLQMDRNGGAYVARNRGLDEARGVYVTLHDADDWSHPMKIETQVRFMEANLRVMGSTTMQARAFSDLSFTRWTGGGNFINANISSFMFRRQPIKDRLGYWDTVRFSGDSELIRRIRERFGAESVVNIPGGPLSFQRDSNTSIVADAVLGMNGFYFGARREYLHAQNHYRAKSDCELKYDGDQSKRPFLVPNSMLPARLNKDAAHRNMKVVVAADLRGPAQKLTPTLKILDAASKDNEAHAYFEIFEYNPSHDSVERMAFFARDALSLRKVPILTFGEQVTTDTLVVLGVECLLHRLRYLPSIHPKEVIICCESSLDDHMSTIGFRDQATQAISNATSWFGTEAVVLQDGENRKFNAADIKSWGFDKTIALIDASNTVHAAEPESGSLCETKRSS